MATEVEETLKRIQSHRGVKGVLIVNTEGQPIRSNLSQVSTDAAMAGLRNAAPQCCIHMGFTLILVCSSSSEAKSSNV